METVCIQRRQYCFECTQIESFKTKFFLLLVPSNSSQLFFLACTSLRVHWDYFNRVTLAKLFSQSLTSLHFKLQAVARENLEKFTTFISSTCIWMGRQHITLIQCKTMRKCKGKGWTLDDYVGNKFSLPCSPSLMISNGSLLCTCRSLVKREKLCFTHTRYDVLLRKHMCCALEMYADFV